MLQQLLAVTWDDVCKPVTANPHLAFTMFQILDWSCTVARLAFSFWRFFGFQCWWEDFTEPVERGMGLQVSCEKPQIFCEIMQVYISWADGEKTSFLRN